MAGSMSGGITVQGLGSGTDFTSTIKALKQYELIPKQRMTLWKEEWQIRIDAFNEIIDTMKEAKSALSEFSSLDSMLSRKVSSSDDKVASAKANAKIEEGVYSIDVEQLATAALFSSKKVFSAKDVKINETGAEQSFTYTYKGTTRELKIANGTTLQQFADKINKDGQNPGVKASLVKSGSGYVLQIQGKSTGAASSLSIESTLPDFDASPHFSGRDYVVNSTGANKSFTFSYGGKDYNINVTPGMTAGKVVDEINNLGAGVKVSLAQDGSDYKFQWKDSKTNQVVSVPTRSDLEELGARGKIGGSTITAGTNINPTSDVQTYKYSYLGKEYSLNVSPGTTMQGLVDQINGSAPSGLDARFDAASGTIKFDSTEQYLSSTDGADMKFSLTKPGDADASSITIPAGSTLEQFVEQFNKSDLAKGRVDLNDPTKNFDGVTAYLDNSSGTNVLKFKNAKDTTDPPVALTPAELAALGVTTNVNGLAGDGSVVPPSTKTDVPLGVSTSLEGVGGIPKFSGKNININESSTNQNFNYTYNGTTSQISVPPGMTMEEFAKAFNDDATAKGLDIKANVTPTGSGYEIKYTDAAGKAASPQITVPADGSLRRLRGSQDNWHSAQATDAIFTVNGWDQKLTSDSNTLTEVIDGLTITLKGKGTTSLSVTNDPEALKENIEKVVDAINLMRTTIKELSKVDEDKETKKPEVDDETGLLKLQSQFTWQKGGATTGNYGVQMLNSRLNGIASGSGVGFVGRSSNDDSFNDIFTALSQIGISTVSSEGDQDFGLLRIDDAKLTEALEKDFRGVAELFSAKKQTTTDSSDFSVASAGTKAKAGVYDVTYDVDPVTKKATNVWINGSLATTDSAYPGRWTVGDMSNAAVGLAIQFTDADLTPSRNPDGTIAPNKGTVRIKDGKVNQMIDQLNAEIQPVVRTKDKVTGQDTVYVENGGALPLLIDNYRGIISGIDKKIDRETVRVAQWEKRQKAKYSRLDTLLAQYNQKMQSATAALAQLE